MTQFRNVLIVITCVMVPLTVVAFMMDGVDFLSPYFAPIGSGMWQGHINVDFGFYLFVAMLWIAWRFGFSRGGIALAVLAAPMGMVVFAPLLLIFMARGDTSLEKLLMGVHAKS